MKKSKSLEFLQGIKDFFEFGLSYSYLAKPLLKEGLKQITKIPRLIQKELSKEMDINDRRFRYPKWKEHFFFNFILKSYLKTYQITTNFIELTELDPFAKKQIIFLARLFFDAFSPANFPFTNPEVIDKTIQTHGENLKTGFNAFLSDLKQWKGYVNVTRTPISSFELGKNIATTPGKIVYQNELMQLIQYEPSTPKVQQEPILILSSWINKYYVFDLKSSHSLIRWLVSKGYTVFAISWINPDTSLKHKNFSDYVLEGPVDAIRIIQSITKTKKIHALGYCLGGTLLAAAAGYLAKNQNDPFQSITLLASLLDFSNPGLFENLTGEKQLQFFESNMKTTGIWSAEKMSAAFNLIAMNETIWFYWIRHYLLGKLTPAYDSLYWAMDMTNTPEALYRFYTRVLYHDNGLAKQKIKIEETIIDLTHIKAPVFFLGLKDDYISPWESCYESYQHLKMKDKQFVLAYGGHFNGITSNPEQRQAKHQRVNSTGIIKNAKTWEKKSKIYEKSWQSYWLTWIQEHSADQFVDSSWRIPPGNLESAPGNYAKKSILHDI